MDAPLGDSPEGRRGQVDTSPPEERYCLGCSYALMGLPQNRCPECGREFDPTDPRTFLERLPATWAKRVGEAVCDLERFGAWVLAAVVIAAMIASAAGELFLVLPLGLAVVVVYLMVACAAVCVRLVGICRAPRWRWKRAGILLVLGATVAFTNWPLRLTFACSRGSLEQLASQVRAGQSPPVPVRAGLFIIKKTEMRRGVVCLWTDPNSAGPTGFANCTPADVTGRFNLWHDTFLADRWQWIDED